MCELLGLSFNQPIRPSFSFSGLLMGSEHNADGWGMGFYPEQSNSAMVFKEPITGQYSQLAEFLCSYRGLRAKTFISHIRRSSKGRLCHDNTHPFSRHFGGREWLFAHNGTLQSSTKLKQLSFKPAGDTDSERAFCFLLSQFRKQKIKPVFRGKYIGYTDNDLWSIYDILTNINVQADGAFNVIFTDGTFLFCYRDIIGARRLYYLERKYPFAKAELRDGEMIINFNLEKGRTERGFVIASAKLSSENWTSFKPGQLLVFRNGQKVADIGGTTPF